MLLITLFLALIISNVPAALAQMEQGGVTVRVLYHGTVPPPTDVNVTRDPEICGTRVLLQSLTVHSHSGGLKDAVVTIDGIPAPETAQTGMAPIVLSNSRCSFSPHVMSLQTGSPLEIHNQDPIMHNTHISYEMRTFINVAMVVNGRPVAKTVVKPGLYRVQCDVHKFMGGYVLASTHPYFGVTDDHGNTKILNVPAGHHDLSVWHERLGRLQAHVSVPPNGEATATFEFREDGTGHGRHMNR
jgi:plastocyanin